MKLFSFFRRKKEPNPFRDLVPDCVDKSKWIGKDFYFLITGVGEIDEGDYDNIMTPKSLEWSRLSPKWTVYKVGNDLYGVAFEKYGVDMVFNETIEFIKAKKIADEIVENICSKGQMACLHVIEKPTVYLQKNEAQTHNSAFAKYRAGH